VSTEITVAATPADTPATVPATAPATVPGVGGIQVTNMDDLARMSTAIARSGMFKDAQTPERAAVKMMFAMAMGFEPITGLTGVDIIEGNPTPNGHFWAAALESHPRYDYEVTRSDSEACTIVFYRDGKRRGEVTWTIEDAKRAGLAGKDNWRKYPRAMLYNRAMTEGGRMFCPQLFGGVRAYNPEELDHIAPAAAAEPPPLPPAPQAPPPPAAAPPAPEVEDAEVIDAGPVDDRPITQAQRKRLFAIANSSNWTDEGWRGVIEQVTGDPGGSTSSVTRGNYEEICALIERGPQAGPGQEALDVD
jgi:hypothetical protein